ncbi:hypothetical protein BpHYR1_014958 [Brachionus plicatilis]|uniref:Uncharacterized protein n=1 Tax=Brachionus plicatilis TaxID=10195 RepID=A0A3M7QUB5_BRAPC|nr:hypothetical protein BpHYR1_014958 [Brachionus plicatilis]
MARFIRSDIIYGLFSFLFALKTVVCSEKLVYEEQVALTRDHFGRDDPNELFYGFFPFWAVVIYIIAGTCLVISMISGVCYLLGCKNPDKTKYVAADH